MGLSQGQKERIVVGRGSCDEGVGAGAAILSSTTNSLWDSEPLRVSISGSKAGEKNFLAPIKSLTIPNGL